MDAFDDHIAAIFEEHQSRAFHFEVGALGILSAALPIGGPERTPVAVERARAGDADAGEMGAVHERGTPRFEVAFDPRILLGIVGQVRGAQQHGPLDQVQAGALLKKQGPRLERPRGNYHAAAIGRSAVDRGLDGAGVERVAVADGAKISDRKVGGTRGRGKQQAKNGEHRQTFQRGLRRWLKVPVRRRCETKHCRQATLRAAAETLLPS